jgi:hypothetical protein
MQVRRIEDARQRLLAAELGCKRAECGFGSEIAAWVTNSLNVTT